MRKPSKFFWNKISCTLHLDNNVAWDLLKYLFIFLLNIYLRDNVDFVVDEGITDLTTEGNVEFDKMPANAIPRLLLTAVAETVSPTVSRNLRWIYSKDAKERELADQA